MTGVPRPSASREHDAKRLVPVNKNYQGPRLAQHLVLLHVADRPDILDSVTAGEWFDLGTPVLGLRRRHGMAAGDGKSWPAGALVR